MVELEDIAGVSELARILHVNPTTIANWARVQPTFPKYTVMVSGRPAYNKLEVANWWVNWFPQKKIPKVGYIDDDLRERALEWQRSKLT
jgi:hypothetical protein